MLLDMVFFVKTLNQIEKSLQGRVFALLAGNVGKSWTAPVAAKHGHFVLTLHLVKAASPDLMLMTFVLAARYGRTPILAQMFEHFGVYPPDLPFEIVCRGTGSLETLQYVKNSGFYNITYQVADAAAANGFLPIVKWLKQIGIECSIKGVNAAIRYANLDVLYWLKQNNLVFYSITTLETLASYGYLNMLEALHTSGIPVTEIAVENAVKRGHLSIVRYMVNLGLALNVRKCMLLATQSGNEELILYLHQLHGTQPLQMNKSA